jgi:hypothetical protein
LTKFDRSYDILVAGAGIAGIAAALETARAGLSTCLIEKTILTGGLATSGIVNIYLPICDGRGRQVTFGIAEELLHLSYRYGPGDVPGDWREVVEGTAPSRFRVTFSPAAFILALDEVLVQAGVDVWLDTLVSTPITDGDRVTGVEAENKSGRGVLRAKCVIDATGDADVAYLAGAECAEDDNWLSVWALETSLEVAREAVEANSGAPLLSRLTLGGWNNGQNHPGGVRKFRGTSGADVTEFVLRSRDLVREVYTQSGQDRHDRFCLTLPSMAQFRTTRRIVGETTMADGQDGRHIEESVGLVPDWRRAGPVWEVPYGALIPRKVKGLLAAGRCVDSEADAWEVMRVIPPCALTGQIAGIAATLAVHHNTTPDALAPSLIQTKLAEYGIPYHLAQVGL